MFDMRRLSSIDGRAIPLCNHFVHVLSLGPPCVPCLLSSTPNRMQAVMEKKLADELMQIKAGEGEIATEVVEEFISIADGQVSLPYPSRLIRRAEMTNSVLRCRWSCPTQPLIPRSAIGSTPSSASPGSAPEPTTLRWRILRHKSGST